MHESYNHVWTCLNTSERVWTRPNVSDYVRASLDMYKRVMLKKFRQFATRHRPRWINIWKHQKWMCSRKELGSVHVTWKKCAAIMWKNAASIMRKTWTSIWREKSAIRWDGIRWNLIHSSACMIPYLDMWRCDSTERNNSERNEETRNDCWRNWDRKGNRTAWWHWKGKRTRKMSSPSEPAATGMSRDSSFYF